MLKILAAFCCFLSFPLFSRKTKPITPFAPRLSSPKDYDKINHISEAVIGDIAAWLLQTARK